MANEFFEIINWKKAQPRMKGGGQDWLKLYTSLLDHDGFAAMDDSARMLIIALWLYAARTGLHIFPADMPWLKNKISLLNKEPDLQPLLEAKDIYGNPTPFIKYCDPPVKRKKKPAKKKQPEKSRSEESRVEKKEQTKPLRVSEKKNRLKKERIMQTETAEKSENPKESDAGSAKGHILPKPTRSVNNRPQSLGSVINDWLPEHWQDASAEAYGWSIIRALGYKCDPNNLYIRGEWGAFASFYIKIKNSIPPNMLTDILNKGIEKAEYLRRKSKSHKNLSAVWFHIMYSELSKYRINLNHPSRASPV